MRSIQIDLGVDLMTGGLLREQVTHRFTSKKDYERTVDVLRSPEHEHKSRKQVSELITIVKQMEFFKEQIVPMTDEDALMIARRLSYEYVPKGQPVRQALSQSTRLYYIMYGKVVLSLPQPEVVM